MRKENKRRAKRPNTEAGTGMLPTTSAGLKRGTARNEEPFFYPSVNSERPALTVVEPTNESLRRGYHPVTANNSFFTTHLFQTKKQYYATGKFYRKNFFRV
jgi:hypothetical protein